MKAFYDGTAALRMPQNFVAVKSDEMEYLDGGQSLAVSTAYLNKSTCSSLGTKFANSSFYGTVGLNASRIAHEIYAHAFAYYAGTPVIAAIASKLGGFLGLAVATPIVSYIRSHANPINIGGDSDTLVAAYDLIWTYF